MNEFKNSFAFGFEVISNDFQFTEGIGAGVVDELAELFFVETLGFFEGSSVGGLGLFSEKVEGAVSSGTAGRVIILHPLQGFVESCGGNSAGFFLGTGESRGEDEDCAG